MQKCRWCKILPFFILYLILIIKSHPRFFHDRNVDQRLRLSLSKRSLVSISKFSSLHLYTADAQTALWLAWQKNPRTGSLAKLHENVKYIITQSSSGAIKVSIPGHKQPSVRSGQENKKSLD